jgi:hypothetical protein
VRAPQLHAHRHQQPQQHCTSNMYLHR